MMEQIIQLDHRIFYYINTILCHSVLDFIMPYLRNKYFWAPLYLFLIVFLAVNYKKRGVIAIIFILLTIVLSDQVSSSIIKPFFHRIRPCNHPLLQEYVRSLVACGGGYSFTSSHAANHFALAAIVSFILYKRYQWVLLVALSWAFMVSYAQVYVGLHYPLDIIGGAAVGIIIGSLLGFAYQGIYKIRKVKSL